MRAGKCKCSVCKVYQLLGIKPVGLLCLKVNPPAQSEASRELAVTNKDIG